MSVDVENMSTTVKISNELLQTLQGAIHFNHPLADYTSWRTGGLADCLYLPKNLEELAYFLKNIDAHIPITFLGLGSNTLIRKGGIDGIVIITQPGLNKIIQLSDHEIYAEAGVASAQFARYTARLGLSGLEFLAGVPGTIGGALAMNAGCFGGETWEYVTQIDMINPQGQRTQRDPSLFQVSYRHVAKPAAEWFAAGIFRLKKATKDIAMTNIRTLLERRNATQPTGTANCGSVFKNPPGDFAGRLIETCCLKGKTIGSAQVSTKHANFIINSNPHDDETSANSDDIERLILEVAAIVEQKTSVRLITEVCIIGRA